MNSIVYILLSPLYLIYLCIIFIRNLLYDLNILSANKIDCKIISIGNISFGGTGKTPFTIALAKELQSKYHVAILSRGYKRDSRGTVLVTDGTTTPKDWKIVGDEPYLMSQKLSGIPIVVDENRTRGGNFLVNNFKPDIILLDDGFQHRKLHRDVDIVLLDASVSNRFNYWRETISSLRRANIVVLTKSDDKNQIALWRGRVAKINLPVYITNNSIGTNLISANKQEISRDNFKRKPIITFSGIANHDTFNHTVKQMGCIILGSLPFKDHHDYGVDDMKILELKYAKLKPDYIFTTEKDLLKLPPSNLPIYAVPIRMAISKNIVEKLDNIIKSLD